MSLRTQHTSLSKKSVTLLCKQKAHFTNVLCSLILCTPYISKKQVAKVTSQWFFLGPFADMGLWMLPEGRLSPDLTLEVKVDKSGGLSVISVAGTSVVMSEEYLSSFNCSWRLRLSLYLTAAICGSSLSCCNSKQTIGHYAIINKDVTLQLNTSSNII